MSDELNGKSIDPDDTVRTRHLRHFNGLHEAIYENAVSRVFLGVHWRFDGTTGTDTTSMFARRGDQTGGVPLGLTIAEDLFAQATAKKIAPTPASVRPPQFDATP